MKVTALLPDPLIEKVRHYAQGKNLTDSLIIVLKDWLAHKKLVELNQRIEHKPLRFKKGFSANQIRLLNRS